MLRCHMLQRYQMVAYPALYEIFIRAGQFSEFKITVCGSCKMSTKKLKWHFLIFKKIFVLQKSLIISPPP